MGLTPKTEPFHVVLANCAFEHFKDPDALLARYHSLTGWADALAEVGADRVTVVQRFEREASVRRGRVQYTFVADGGPPYPPPWFWGKRVTDGVLALRPTIVDVRGLVFPLIVRHLRARLGRRTPIMVRDHGGFEPHSPSFRGRLRRRFYRLGLGAADGFFFTAQEQARPWLRAGIIRREETVHEVPEASTSLGSQPPPAGQQRLPGRPALLWVARLDENKDPLTILNGFAAASAALPQAELTMVYGEENLIAAVKARLAADSALAGRVHLRGRMERAALPPLYAGADVFVLGSHHEVACFALLEALSFGVTPVVTDIPPFRILTDGGRIGALFQPGAAGQLAVALERVGRDDFALRRRAVLEHFERQLSWQAIGHRALAIYRAAAAVRA